MKTVSLVVFKKKGLYTKSWNKKHTILNWMYNDRWVLLKGGGVDGGQTHHEDGPACCEIFVLQIC